MKKQYDDDDGRTIADMSCLDNRSVMSGVMTGLILDKMLRERKAEKNENKHISQAAGDKPERRTYILGAMSAGLVIGLIFLAVFAVAIILILIISGQM